MSTFKIAIAEDNQLVRRGLVFVMQNLPGLDTQVIFDVSNGKELLEKVAIQQPDIVLMDIEMPLMRGPEATQILKQRYPDIKVIALSVYTEDDFILEMIRSGARAFLTKDEDPEEVARAIKSVMEAEYYFNQKTNLAMRNQLLEPKPEPATLSVIQLKEHEIRTLQLICQEKRTHEIADVLCQADRTVDGYRRALLEKTGALNTAGLVIFAIKYGYYKV